MLHTQKVDFDDHRVVDAAEWDALKATSAFGRLPLYESGALVLCESQAILRHLARSFGWLGTVEQRDGLLDITQEVMAEAQEDLWRFAWVKDYHQQGKRYATQTLEPRLRYLQNWLCRDGRDTPYWVGETISHVDFLAFCYLDELDAFFPDTLESFPALAAFRSRIARANRANCATSRASPVSHTMPHWVRRPSRMRW